MDLQHEPPQANNPLVVRLQKNKITEREGEKKSPKDLPLHLSSEPDLNQRQRDAELIQSQKNIISELKNEHQLDAEMIQWQKSKIAKLGEEIKAYEDLLAELPTTPTWDQLHQDDELIQSQKNRISELEHEHQRDAETIQWQKSRITKLDEEIKAYEDLLTELPDVFERRFQQRLEPLMERYQLLAEQVDQDQVERPQQALPGSSEPDNIVRFPGLKLPKFLQKRQRSA